MAIHIICPPGPYGGVISGSLDPKIGTLPDEIAIYQRIGKAWSSRVLHVVAARLWSCDLGYQEPLVDEWMAAVVSKDFDPNRQPHAGDRIFQVTQKPASTLSVRVATHAGEKFLEGNAPPESDGVYSFLWWHPPRLARGDVPGWDPLDLVDPIACPSDSWTVRVAPAPQFAVVHVRSDKSHVFKSTSKVKERILPSRHEHVHAMAFTAKIDISILTTPGHALTGVVTGLGCVFDRVRELGPLELPREDELLRVAAWIIDSAGNLTLIGTTLCRPSGYWIFDRFPTAVCDAKKFVAVVTTQQFDVAPDAIPKQGGEVIAVTWSPPENPSDSERPSVTQP
jgi:hypothetical protein